MKKFKHRLFGDIFSSERSTTGRSLNRRLRIESLEGRRMLATLPVPSISYPTIQSAVDAAGDRDGDTVIDVS